jgi:hypothetical protein
MTTKLNAWDWDLRVRERNLKAGVLTDKDVEKYLSQVTDTADQSEPFGTPQPALDPPEELVTAGADEDDEDEGQDSASDEQGA